jgi:hypothetical protein
MVYDLVFSSCLGRVIVVCGSCLMRFWSWVMSVVFMMF